MAREQAQQQQPQTALQKFVAMAKEAREGLKDLAASPGMAPVWGALNQGRMEAAHVFGKILPDQPQFDDPAAIFNRTPLEGYQLKHGIEPPKVKDAEMGKEPELDR
jgi:hypothetical protein